MADLALIKASGSLKSESAQPASEKLPKEEAPKYNSLFWLLNGSLTFYQKIISPQISASCLYETSCSRFSRKAIHAFGLLKGVALTADRLSRCNRISATDIHLYHLNAEGLVIDEPSMYRFK